MADELDSGSSVGYYVWVQVPSSALYIREGLRGIPEVFFYIQTEACLVPKCSRSPFCAPSSTRKEEKRIKIF